MELAALLDKDAHGDHFKWERIEILDVPGDFYEVLFRFTTNCFVRCPSLPPTPLFDLT